MNASNVPENVGMTVEIEGRSSTVSTPNRDDEMLVDGELLSFS